MFSPHKKSSLIEFLIVMAMSWPEFDRVFRREIRHLSHQRLKSLSKAVSTERKLRFNENHSKQTEMERSFSDEEFAKFMSVVKDPIDRAAFLVMATLALRPCELCALKGRDVQGGHMRVPGAKGSYSGCYALPAWLEALIPCCGPEDNIFPSTKTLRLHFVQYRRLAGLESCYLLTKPCGRAGVQNHRYRISLHSFRHFAIQRFYDKTHDPDLTRAFARHKDMKSTGVYMRKSLGDSVNLVLAAETETRISASMA